MDFAYLVQSSVVAKTTGDSSTASGSEKALSLLRDISEDQLEEVFQRFTGQTGLEKRTPANPSFERVKDVMKDQLARAVQHHALIARRLSSLAEDSKPKLYKVFLNNRVIAFNGVRDKRARLLREEEWKEEVQQAEQAAVDHVFKESACLGLTPQDIMDAAKYLVDRKNFTTPITSSLLDRVKTRFESLQSQA